LFRLHTSSSFPRSTLTVGYDSASNNSQDAQVATSLTDRGWTCVDLITARILGVSPGPNRHSKEIVSYHCCLRLTVLGGAEMPCDTMRHIAKVSPASPDTRIYLW